MNHSLSECHGVGIIDIIAQQNSSISQTSQGFKEGIDQQLSEVQNQMDKNDEAELSSQ